MKTSFLLIATLLISGWGFSQDSLTNIKANKEVIKKGWNILPFPYLTFDADLGIEFGASSSFVNYGDGKIYPKYYHMIAVSASVYTKGSATLLFSYDSDHLIKGFKTKMDVAYLPDLAFDFFGYNGYDAVYNESWRTDGSPDYRSRMFYKQKRKMLRVRTTFEHAILNSHFRWLTGFEFYSVKTSTVNIDRLNKDKKDNLLPSVDSVPPLYDRYVHWGIISEAEKAGGFFSLLKAGLVYDTRDEEQSPMRGIWAEATLLAAPGFMSTMDGSFLKLAVYWRQYIPFIKNRLSLAYRLNYQSTIAGYAPVYTETFMFNSVANGLYNEGLGGAKTVRGMVRNRAVGDGIVSANFELRWAFVKVILFKQNIDFVLSGFFDTGRVVKKINIDDKINALTDDDIDYKHVGDTKADYFTPGAEKFHNTAGGGLHLIVNHNIVVAADFAKAFNKQDGTGLGVYIGSYFLF